MVKKTAENQEMAQELEKWARKFDSHNELTKKLLSDLETKNDLFKWAELDPFEFLPMPVAGKSHKKNTNHLFRHRTKRSRELLK